MDVRLYTEFMMIDLRTNKRSLIEFPEPCTELQALQSINRLNKDADTYLVVYYLNY